MRRASFLGVCAVLLSAQIAAAQATLTVGKGGGYDHETIQAAIDAAAAGDTIVVYPGTYTENIRIGGKDVVLRSTDPADTATVAATIIDGNHADTVVTFDGTETSACVLSGFTIRYGLAWGPNPYDRGGGIRGGTEASPTHALIENNFITSNTAWDGGGMVYCDGTIRNNTVTTNTAIDDGGGLHRCNGTIESNRVTSNTATDGGGLAKCDGTIRNNEITSNTASDDAGALFRCNGTVEKNVIAGNHANDRGGGMDRCAGTIRENTFTGNVAWSEGGAISYCDGLIAQNTFTANEGRDGGAISYCNGTIADNTFTSNKARHGGALFNCDGPVRNNTFTGNQARRGGALHGSDGTIQNNLITGNTAYRQGDYGGYGGGLYMCNGTIQSNTITSNTAMRYGGGLCYCDALTRNCIIWGNFAFLADDQICVSFSPSFSAIEQWPGGGTDNTTSDPLFVAPATGNFRLQAGSPCIDKGVNGYWWVWPQRDLDGNCRLAGARIDMGCYEYGSSPDGDGDLLADADEPGHGADPLLDDTDGDSLRDGLEVLRGTNPAVVTPPGTLAVPGDYAKIQDALAVSLDGDEIVVSPGTFAENLHFCGANPTLRSTDPLDPSVVASTILDGSDIGPVVTFTGGENPSCVLAGFTIRHGRSGLYGAGICGGTSARHTHATVQNNTISGNVAFGSWPTGAGGGGIALCDGLIHENNITSNAAETEGGGLAYCHGTIQYNIVSGNAASGTGPYGAGGGLGSCHGTVQFNTITRNTANNDGGGLFGCDAIIQNNRIFENFTTQDGGGLDDCDGTIQNNLIVDNLAIDEGGGLSGCDGAVLNNTIVGNHAGDNGGGLNHCLGIIRNCILWANTTSNTVAHVFESNLPAHSCIDGWTSGGSNNITDAPAFVNAAAGDYHLQAGSPCIDAGENYYWFAWPLRDFDDNCRLVGDHIDIGCYEFGSSPDTDGDLLADTAEPMYGTATDVADTDGDGLRDGLEILRQSDPLTSTPADSYAIPREFPSIQEALCLAVEGDEFVVWQGHYFVNAYFCGANVTLRSTGPQVPGIVELTILDGVGAGPVVRLMGHETSATLVAGFTIRNGTADHGAGIQGGTTDHHCSATIRHNVIEQNWVARGGAGICWVNGLIESNTIVENLAENDGGGISQCHGTIQYNTITSNRAHWNGGGVANSDGTIRKNTLSGNLANGGGGGLVDCLGTIDSNTVTNNSAGFGGGMARCEGMVLRNTIVLNSASNGGGLADCGGTIRNNVISLNSARYDGGGVYDCEEPRLQNNLITRNTAAGNGGGLARCYAAMLENNTIADNVAGADGGGLFRIRDTTIRNCILWGNSDPAIMLFEGAILPAYSCIQGWTGGGVGNVTADPHFIDPDGPDDDPGTYDDNIYRLAFGSPAIDAGTTHRPYDDACRPPGLRTVHNDMGVYGGPFNCFWVSPPACDLIGTLSSVGPDPMGHGDPIDFEGTVVNQGDEATTAAATVEFWAINLYTRWGGYLCDPITVGPLGPGESFDLAGSAPQRVAAGDIPAGVYRIEMRINPDAAVAEWDETNNIARWQEVVIGPATPNLTVSGFDFLPQDVSPDGGTSITFSGVVRNEGSGPTTGGFTLALTVWPDFDFQPTGPALCDAYRITATLDPDEEIDLAALPARATYALTAGVYCVGIQVDSLDEIAELREDDNLTWVVHKRLYVGPRPTRAATWMHYR